MKFIVFVVLFLAVASFARASDDRSSDRSEELLKHITSKHLRQFVEENLNIRNRLTVLEAVCPGSQEKLISAIAELKRCDDEEDESGLTICEYFNRCALNSFTPLIIHLDDCLPSNAKGMVALGSKSIVSAVHYLCGLQGESIIELINPCIFEDPSEATRQPEDCESKILASFRNITLTPSEMCGHSGDYKTCYQAHVNLKCKNPKTRASFLGLLDALLAPCSVFNEI